METLPHYTNPDCIRFVADMISAGREEDLRHYQGRNMWTGPAVVADSTSEIAAETSVRVQSDNMGRSYIIYPIARDKGEATAEEAEAATMKAHGDHLLDMVEAFGDKLDEVNSGELDPDAEALFEQLVDALTSLGDHLRTGN